MALVIGAGGPSNMPSQRQRSCLLLRDTAKKSIMMVGANMITGSVGVRGGEEEDGKRGERGGWIGLAGSG